MNIKKTTVILAIVIIMTILPVCTQAVPIPHSIAGTVYMSDGVTQAPVDTNFDVTDTTSGYYQVGTTGSGPNTGGYAITIDGEDGDTVIVKAWNATHYGTTTITLFETMAGIDVIISVPVADTTDPEIHSVSLDDTTPCEGDTITVTVVATDNSGVVASVTANGEALANTQGTTTWVGTITAEAEGTHTVEVIATDETGNSVTDTTASYTSSICSDVTDPVIVSVTLDDTTPCEGDTITVTVVATDDSGVVASVTANGENLANTQGTTTWVGTITAEAEGTHTVEVIATDEAGNSVTDTTASYTSSICSDITDPVIVSATLDDTTPCEGDTITVTVVATDDSGVVASVTANGEYLANTQGTTTWVGTITAEAEGTHTVEVIATDEAGNSVTDTTASYTSSICSDITDPVIVSVTLDDTTPCEGDTITVTVVATDDSGVVASVTANGEYLANTQGTTTWVGTITAEAEGTHTVEVIATDEAGNSVTDTTASYTSSICSDITDPVIVSATLDDTTPCDGDTITVTVVATDDSGVVASVTANGEALANTQGTTTWVGTITAEAEGTHTVEVIATDEAGNSVTDTTASYTSSICDPKTEIPEFSTIAIPIAAVLGLMFFFSRRK